jgi:RNA polymerase primary sigma factor
VKNKILNHPGSPPANREACDFLETYLQEISHATGFTKEEDIEIGKQIEKAKRTVARMLCRYPQVILSVIRQEEPQASTELVEEGDFGDVSESDMRSPEVWEAVTLREQLLFQMEEIFIGLDLHNSMIRDSLSKLQDYMDQGSGAAQTVGEWAGERGISYDAAVEALNGACPGDRKYLTIKSKAYRALKRLQQVELETGTDLKRLESDVKKALEAFDEAKSATKKLVEANLRMVYLIARKYVSGGHQMLDLIQEGNIGLIRAATKYDHRFDCKFSTYASWWVRQAIARYVKEHSSTIRLPHDFCDAVKRVANTSAEFCDLVGENPSPEEIGLKTKFSSEKVKRILEAKGLQYIISLHTPLGDGDLSLGDTIEYEDGFCPETTVIRKNLVEKIHELLSTLSPEEELILCRRFGIGGWEEHTLQEVGSELGLTRERVRQIQAKGLERMRHPTRLGKLESDRE